MLMRENNIEEQPEYNVANVFIHVYTYIQECLLLPP